MTGTRPPAWFARGIAVVVLLATGIVSLPAVALVLDGPDTENLVLPAQLVLMAGVGAGLFEMDELSSLWKSDKIFMPQMSRDEAAARKLFWNKALARCQ